MTTVHTELDEKQKNADRILQWMYGYVGDWVSTWRGRAYFTESGVARLSSIAGYITGLMHAGQTEFAHELIDDFYRNMSYLCLFERTTDFDGHIVPARKVVMGDDRNFHSFNFLALSPIPPKVFQGEYNANLDLCGDNPEKAREMTIKKLNIVERSLSDTYYNVLTEVRYDNGIKREVFYGSGWHGALIYHGPGQGQTFTVSIGNEKRTLWQTHS